MILTTPTKNFRKRSNANTAETYGVTFKTQTRNSESKKPRNQETQKPSKMNASAARTKSRHEVTALGRWETTPGALKNDLNTAL